jgi:hypothetical protein
VADLTTLNTARERAYIFPGAGHFYIGENGRGSPYLIGGLLGTVVIGMGVHELLFVPPTVTCDDYLRCRSETHTGVSKMAVGAGIFGISWLLSRSDLERLLESIVVRA